MQLLEAQLRARVWFDYVPFASNAADLPTRLDDAAYARSFERRKAKNRNQNRGPRRREGDRIRIRSARSRAKKSVGRLGNILPSAFVRREGAGALDLPGNRRRIHTAPQLRRQKRREISGLLKVAFSA